MAASCIEHNVNNGQEQHEEAEERNQVLESQNSNLREANEGLKEELAELRKINEEHSREISNLRSRSTLSQQNWIKERDEYAQREATILEQLENAKEAMQDWEVVAMEERSIRENLAERVSVLEDQLSNLNESLEKTSTERDDYLSTVNRLQRALQDYQDGVFTH
jgi:chromosome segregation ATPase